MMNIQKQPNGSNCGLYAIANVLAVCLGKNLCKLNGQIHSQCSLQLLSNAKLKMKLPRIMSLYLSDAGDQEEDGAKSKMWRLVPP